MKWKIPQHIYTARWDFETVAVTQGIGDELRSHLEKRAQVSPFVGAARQPGPPPYVVRGFLLPGQEELYGVSLLLYTGRSMNRGEGNYVAHSYLIPPGLLLEQRFNLPWIAMLLPLAFGYKPRNPSGPDQIPPLELEMDPNKQFGIFAFLAQELGRPNLDGLVNRLIERACAQDGRPLELTMPAPTQDTGRIFSEVLGEPLEQEPAPDRLRLMRLAGALAVLPASFKRGLTFTVNEVTSESYAIRVGRDPAPDVAGQPEPWPWLEHCLALTAAAPYTEIGRMHDWLSRLMPVHIAPSRRALDLGFGYWREVVVAQPVPDAAFGILERLPAFNDLQVDVGALFEPAAAKLAETSWEDRRTLCVELCRVADSARLPLPDAVAVEVTACLVAGEGMENARQTFFRTLPRRAQGSVWARTWRERTVPGYVPGSSERPDPIHANFALANFDPESVPEDTAREIIAHLLDCLSRMAEITRADYRGSLLDDRRSVEYEKRRRMLRIMRAWTALPECQSNLSRVVARHLARDFHATTRGRSADNAVLDLHSTRDEELSDLLDGLLYKPCPIGPAALAAFLDEVRRYDHLSVIYGLFRLRLDPYRRGKAAEMLRCLDRLCSEFTTESLALGNVVQVLLELIGALERPERLSVARLPRDLLPRFFAWANYLQQTSEAKTQMPMFERLLSGVLNDASLPVSTIVAVGSLYLRFLARDLDYIFHGVVSAIEHRPAELGRWLVQGTSPGAGLVSLARFLVVATVRGNQDAERAWIAVERMLAVLSRSERKIVNRELLHDLSQVDVPGWIRKRMRHGAETGETGG